MTSMRVPWARAESGGVGSTTHERVALLSAIARHDAIDLGADLPMRIAASYPPDLLQRCHGLAADLWREVDRRQLRRLASSLAYGRSASAAELCALRDVRARAKQLRFMETILSAGHGCPPALDRATRLIGKLQDAQKGGHRVSAAVRAAMLRVVLLRPASAFVGRSTAADPDRLRAFVRGESVAIRTVLDAPGITNRTFHETRKIVSRMVAFYDTLTVLAPSDDHTAIDRFLSTINGLMGGLHDTMIERKGRDRRAYTCRPEPLPREIADRLARLAAALEG